MINPTVIQSCIKYILIKCKYRMGALSKGEGIPAEEASRPFDSKRDGFVLGEGSGTLILEELEHAIKRGAHILCEVSSPSFTSDAYHMTTPSSDGAYRSMKLSLENFQKLKKFDSSSCKKISQSSSFLIISSGCERPCYFYTGRR